MKLTITTQAEFDKLPKSFIDFTYIHVNVKELIHIKFTPQNSLLYIEGNSQATLWGNSQATLWENSQATLRENSQATLWGNSQATLWGNSQATLWENSQATLWGNSQATLWGNSQATLWENSQAIGYQQVSLRIESGDATAILFGFACALVYIAKAKITKRSDNCQIVNINVPAPQWTVEEYIEKYGLKRDGSKVIIYKRVSSDFKTQEGTRNETLWAIGASVKHPNWIPYRQECGEGKFHACSYAYFCDDFRSKKPDDKYVAIEVEIADMFAWKNPRYPTKIAFREGFVLHQCDKYGKKIA
jgi:phage gp45-like